MTIRVIVAENERVVRFGVTVLLNAEPDIDVVAEADDGAQAIDQARHLQPDVVLMDIRMPGTDGIEATRQVTADTFTQDADRTVKVLALTTFNDDEALYAVLRAGASGFLLKHTAPSDLVSAVRAIAAGNGWLDPAVTKTLVTEFATRADPLRRTPTELDQLTPREHDVLLAVARGLSNAEIAAELHISEGTVKTHLGRVLTKLGLRDRAQAIVAAYENRLAGRTADS
ncbi:response regulator [Streptomyces sp. HD]|uniref:response regulator n=1 Tax=Streptomyces sp. HD TaxID=3020892 RepID=UPI00232C5027|nr:response regulator transcription factor [Streptomyces sp. HD]MDC0773907.1 response regulator transcription factor [Streptomyces sp. HD]